MPETENRGGRFGHGGDLFHVCLEPPSDEPSDIGSEKIIKQDMRRQYDIVVIGEEPHLAYNRVELSSFFEHRKIEDLYINPREWVSVADR